MENFHSTMVRLRRFCVNSQMTFCESYFHSTMVRLRHIATKDEVSREWRFPFHNGSIETLEKKIEFLRQYDFHSTMVQLRPCFHTLFSTIVP